MENFNGPQGEQLTPDELKKRMKLEAAVAEKEGGEAYPVGIVIPLPEVRLKEIQRELLNDALSDEERSELQAQANAIEEKLGLEEGTTEDKLAA